MVAIVLFQLGERGEGAVLHFCLYHYCNGISFCEGSRLKIVGTETDNGIFF